MENKLNRIQKFGLVALRMVIGWHFLYEGVAKLMKGNWSAAGFLMQSKGIFAGIFQGIAANEGLLAIVNQLNIWGLIAIGLGLMLGLFTRMASLFGMLLILLYCWDNTLWRVEKKVSTLNIRTWGTFLHLERNIKYLLDLSIIHRKSGCLQLLLQLEQKS